MIWLVGIIASTVGLYYLTGGAEDRPPVAEGRSWRLVAGASKLDWTRVADAAARFAADGAVLMVNLKNKRGPEIATVLVAVEAQIGPRALRGRFFETLENPLPSPWGPAENTPIDFALEDVVLIRKDWA